MLTKIDIAKIEFKVRYNVRLFQRILQQCGMREEAERAEQIYKMWDAFFNSVRKEVMSCVGQSKSN